jgi:flagellar basal-body rod modification protein FlgD
MSATISPAAASGVAGATASTEMATASKTHGVDTLANRDTFLQLLVAQIRNQNPLNPTDGIQFLSQLAQFSSLEQNLQIRDTLEAIQATLDQRLPAAGGDTGRGN